MNPLDLPPDLSIVKDTRDGRKIRASEESMCPESLFEENNGK